MFSWPDALNIVTHFTCPISERLNELKKHKVVFPKNWAVIILTKISLRETQTVW